MSIKWTVTTGSLPPGLSISTSPDGRQGWLEGRPRASGTYTWGIQATDDRGNTTTASYSMTIASSLVLDGRIFNNNGSLGQLTKQSSFSILNQLKVIELGASGSTFTIQDLSGTKPAWLTVQTGSVTSTTTSIGPVGVYCEAPINFSGTPTDITNTNFTLRVTSSTGAFIDYIILISAASNISVIKNNFSAQLAANNSYVLEGDTVRISLVATGLSGGDTVPYTIGGTINSSDIVGGQLTGTFTLVNEQYIVPNPPPSSGGIFLDVDFDQGQYGFSQYERQTANVDIQLAADLSSEGQETLTLYLTDVAPYNSINVIVADSSLSATLNPRGSLAPSVSSVQEGGSFTVTLTTIDISANTLIYYTIDGVSSDDLYGGARSGYFTIGSNGTATATFSIKPSGRYESKQFRMYVAAQGSLPTALGIVVGITNVSASYDLISSATAISEGGSVTFTLNTTTVADGTSLDYLIQGVSAGDINVPLTGTLTVENNLAGITVIAAMDSATESAEALIFSIPSLGLVKFVNIWDTSMSPPPTNIYLSLVKSNGSELSGGVTLIEGESFYIRIDGSPATIGTNVRYSILGVASNDINIPKSGVVTLQPGYIFGTENSFFYLPVDTYQNTTFARKTVTISLPDYGNEISFDLVSATPSTDPPPGNESTPTTVVIERLYGQEDLD